MTLNELLLLVEGRMVGGAVRNSLLGLPVEDYDIATPLLPQEVMRRAQNAGLSVKPVGIEHGTVVVITPQEKYEITTLREDIKTDGRHAVVRFGTSWERDALRRDFTMNALSQDATGKIYDYVGGVKDIEARHVRFIGKAETRIHEDFLRLLRFFRFSAQFSTYFDEEGVQASFKLKAGLVHLSPERVWEELKKILKLKNSSIALTKMHECGILNEIFTLPCDLNPFQSEDPLLRLASLCVHTQQDVLSLRHKLKLNNAETRRLDTLASGWRLITPSLTLVEAKEMLFKWGKRSFQDRVIHAQVRLNSDFAPLLKLAENWSVPIFTLKGQDLINEGFQEGESLGLELQKRKEAWVKNGFK